MQALHEENTQLITGLQEVSTTLAAALVNRPASALTVQPTVETAPAASFFEVEDDSEDYVLAEDGSNEVMSYEEDAVLLGLVHAES